jgi:peroxiredoxin Q/BCP
MLRQLLSTALAFLCAAVAATAYAGVEVGMKAPDFEAESTMGTIRLSDYLGKKHVLLAVYYKDFTGG